MSRALDIAFEVGPYIILIVIPLSVATCMHGGPRSTAEWIGLGAFATLGSAAVFFLERRRARPNPKL